MMDRCVCCGFPVPEGRQVCPGCEGKAEPDVILKDGTLLYLRVASDKLNEKIPGGFDPQIHLHEV